MLDAFVGGWEIAGMWLFNTGRPWGLPQNVFYVKDAKIENVDYNDPPCHSCACRTASRR